MVRPSTDLILSFTPSFRPLKVCVFFCLFLHCHFCSPKPLQSLQQFRHQDLSVQLACPYCMHKPGVGTSLSLSVWRRGAGCAPHGKGPIQGGLPAPLPGRHCSCPACAGDPSTSMSKSQAGLTLVSAHTTPARRLLRGIMPLLSWSFDLFRFLLQNGIVRPMEKRRRDKAGREHQCSSELLQPSSLISQGSSLQETTGTSLAPNVPALLHAGIGNLSSTALLPACTNEV